MTTPEVDPSAELRRLRLQAGLTQTRLAREAGCSRSHLCNIERGRRRPAFLEPALRDALARLQGRR